MKKVIFLIPFLFCSCTQSEKHKELRIKEANAIIELYEHRLLVSRIEEEQGKIRTANARERYERLRPLAASGAATQEAYHDAWTLYEVLRLNRNKESSKEWEILIELAKIWRDMIEAGMDVNNEKLMDIGKE